MEKSNKENVGNPTGRKLVITFCTKGAKLDSDYSVKDLILAKIAIDQKLDSSKEVFMKLFVEALNNSIGDNDDENIGNTSVDNDDVNFFYDDDCG